MRKSSCLVFLIKQVALCKQITWISDTQVTCRQLVQSPVILGFVKPGKLRNPSQPSADETSNDTSFACSVWMDQSSLGQELSFPGWTRPGSWHKLLECLNRMLCSWEKHHCSCLCPVSSEGGGHCLVCLGTQGLPTVEEQQN